MRDEWSIAAAPGGVAKNNGPASRSTQGLARVGRLQREREREVPSLTLSSMAMRLKSKGAGDLSARREVSERRQVGDAEGLVNPTGSGTPWWRNVGMEEGM